MDKAKHFSKIINIGAIYPCYYYAVLNLLASTAISTIYLEKKDIAILGVFVSSPLWKCYHLVSSKLELSDYLDPEELGP
jgi:hypothetical protein